MAYTRYSRRRNYRRSKKSTSTSTWGGVARKALKVANFVRTLVNVEKKFFDINATALTTMSNTGAVYAMTGVPQGDAYNQREGNSFKLVSQFFRIQAYLNPGNVGGENVRFMVVSDNEDQGSIPAVTDILEVPNVISPLNHTNGTRFKVWYDKMYTMTQEGREVVDFKMFKKCQHHVKFSGPGGGNTREGNLYLLAICNSSTNFPSFSWYNRVRFIDN